MMSIQRSQGRHRYTVLGTGFLSGGVAELHRHKLRQESDAPEGKSHRHICETMEKPIWQEFLAKRRPIQCQRQPALLFISHTIVAARFLGSRIGNSTLETRTATAMWKAWRLTAVQPTARWSLLQSRNVMPRQSAKKLRCMADRRKVRLINARDPARRPALVSELSPKKTRKTLTVI